MDAALGFVPLMYRLDGNVSIPEAAQNAKLALAHGNFRFMGFWPGVSCLAHYWIPCKLTSL